MSSAAVLTIYPTARKVEDVLTARARRGDVSLGHRLTTFPELVDAFDRECAGPPLASDAVAVVLMEEALADAFGDDDRPGLASAALRAIGELKAACLDGEALATIARATTVADVRQRVQWLACVAAAYARQLARVRRADRHDRERRVLDLLERHARAATRPRALAGVARVVIAEIYDYSPLQSLIVRALIRLVGDAELVTLAHAENVDATRFLERTWNRFVEDPAIADKVLPDFVVRGGRGGALERVLSVVFVEPKPPPADDGADATVQVLAAGTRRGEVEAVARLVRRALATGRRAERLAILARELGPYRVALEDVARRHELPIVVDAPRPLAVHAVVDTVVALLAAIADGLPRAALADALTRSHLTAAPPGVRRVLAAIGYVDAATAPFERCVATTERRLARVAGAPAIENATHLSERVRRDLPAVASVVARLGALAVPRTVAEHARSLRAVLGELGFTLPGVDAAAGELATEGAALAALERLLDDLGALGAIADGSGARRDRGAGVRPVPFAAFRRVLEAAIGLVDVDATAPHASGVRALAIADARGLDFDEVFLLGLDDGSFPAPPVEDALLGDHVRREVNRRGAPVARAALGLAAGAPLGRLVRTSAERAAEDPFLFYLALSTAEARVVITYPTRDDEGRPLVRSPFIDEITAILGERVVGSAPPGDPAPAPAACAGVAEVLRAAVVAAVAGNPGLLAAVGGRLQEGALADVVRRMRIERRRARYFLLDRERDGDAKDALADPFTGRLTTTPTLRERLRLMEWSATRLDELGACGFRFFAHRLLGLEPEDEATESLDVRQEGRLVHRLLEMVLRRCDPIPRDPDVAANQARALAAEARDALAAEFSATDLRLFELTWTRAVQALLEVVRAEAAAPIVGGVHRRRLEWPFRVALVDHRAGDSGERLDLMLKGTIDRADLWLDGGRVVAAEVIDYKNAKRDTEYVPQLDPQRAMGTTSFQVPLYALALLADETLVWAPDAAIRGGYVLLRADRKPLVRPLAPALLARDVAARRTAVPGAAEPIANRIVTLVAGAATGRFDVEPRECSRYCSYRHVCRYEPPPEETE